MNRVRAGSRPRSVSAMSAPSTLETKWARRLRGRIGRQRARRHRRAEVGAADADVDDVGHRLAERAAHAALAHVGGEGEHLGALGLDCRARRRRRRRGPAAPERSRKRGVQRRAPFRRIDELAAEHRVALGLDLGRLGEREQQRERLGVDPLLGEIVEEVVEDDVKALETIAGSAANSATERGEQRRRDGRRARRRRREGAASRHGPFPFRRGALCVRPARPSRVCFICRLNCNCETSA